MREERSLLRRTFPPQVDNSQPSADSMQPNTRPPFGTRMRMALRRTFMGESVTTEDRKHHESNLLWGPLGIGASIVITVVAAMKRDLRGLLFLAWPFFVFGIWKLCRHVPYKNLSRWITGFAAVVVAIALVILSNWLKPVRNDDARSVNPYLNAKSSNSPSDRRASRTSAEPAPLTTKDLEDALRRAGQRSADSGLHPEIVKPDDIRMKVSGLFYTPKTRGAVFFVRYGRGTQEDALAPVGLAFGATITNVRTVPVSLDRVSVETRAKGGSWVKLNSIPLLGNRLYWIYNDRTAAIPITLDSIDIALSEKPLTPHVPVRGWMFLVGLMIFRLRITWNGDSRHKILKGIVMRERSSRRRTLRPKGI